MNMSFFGLKAYTDIEEKEPVIRAQLLKDRKQASTRLENCLHRIRLESGYEQFLLEATVKALQQSASEGAIVIVNATYIGCDAIIVSASKVQAITLSEMNSSHAPSSFQQKIERLQDNNRLCTSNGGTMSEILKTIPVELISIKCRGFGYVV